MMMDIMAAESTEKHVKNKHPLGIFCVSFRGYK